MGEEKLEVQLKNNQSEFRFVFGIYLGVAMSVIANLFVALLFRWLDGNKDLEIWLLIVALIMIVFFILIGIWINSILYEHRTIFKKWEKSTVEELMRNKKKKL